MNCWGQKFKISIFGESHGTAVGAVLDGVPAGTKLDLTFIHSEMMRRAPGQAAISTSRKEADDFKFLSGVMNGVTSGTPICIVINNNDTHSQDYTSNLPRPSHADYVGFVKHGKYHDYRGGGHFSGRLTAALVCAGAIAKQLLATKNIFVGAHIKKILDICDTAIDKASISKNLLDSLKAKEFPVISDLAMMKMKEKILEVKKNNNSVGGIIECMAIGLGAGLGEPFFGSLESLISSIVFSIPAVKAIEFGAGFDMTQMLGSEANDEFYFNDRGRVTTYTNNNGGINGGISNGMPLLFSVALKPTPSISRMQRTIDLESSKNVDFKITGRHDPCVVPRATVVIESALSICLCDMITL